MIAHCLDSLLPSARRVIVAGLALALLLAAGPALAGKLDELRAAGIVGERFDGLLELRDKGAADAKKIVEQVNAKRRAIYEKRAAKEGVSEEEVGQIYAKEIMRGAPSGTWFRKANGKWVQQ